MKESQVPVSEINLLKREIFMYNILIVDDEKSERDVILFLLNKYNINFNIFEAANGKDGLAILKKESIDILATDIKLPFYNGIELAAQARTLYSDIEILFFSGYDDFNYVKEAFSLHAVNYILKPVEPSEFYKSISDILNALQAKKINTMDMELYWNNTFFSVPPEEKLHSYEKDLRGDDNTILRTLEDAIRQRNSSLCKRALSELLSKYQDDKQVSHIYIKYVCTNILHILMSALPNLPADEFQKVADEIYSFKKFSTIYKLIEYYAVQVTSIFEQEETSTNKAVFQVCQYIESHYSEDLSLQSLADLVYLNPKYLSRLFIQDKKININKYIKDVRFKKAIDLLLHSNMKITDISKRVGYGNPSYFGKLFQAEYNQTPENYRQLRGSSQLL